MAPKVPVNELANRVVVGALRTGRGQAVEDGRLGLVKIWELQDRFWEPVFRSPDADRFVPLQIRTNAGEERWINLSGPQILSCANHR